MWLHRMDLELPADHWICFEVTTCVAVRLLSLIYMIGQLLGRAAPAA